MNLNRADFETLRALGLAPEAMVREAVSAKLSAREQWQMAIIYAFAASSAEHRQAYVALAAEIRAGLALEVPRDPSLHHVMTRGA